MYESILTHTFLIVKFEFKIINKMKFKNLIVVYLIIKTFNVYSQLSVDKYNFNFEKPFDESSWYCIRDDFRVEMDSLNKVSGKKSLLLSRIYLRHEFNLNLNQAILLPKIVKNIKVSIFAKSDQLFSADIKLTGLDKNRIPLISDSLSINGSQDWKQFVTEINSKQGIEILLIEIRAKEPFKENKKKVKLWIDNLQITLEGIDLYDFKDTKEQYSKTEYKDISKAVKINSLLEIPPQNIDSIRGKIIGFGETIHGSKEISQSVYNNFKQLITRHNCRLILLELSIDLGIRLNQYVQEEKIDEELTDLVSGNLFDNEELCSFLNWVKQYNSGTKDKVTIFGFDFYTANTPRYINNFLLSKKPNSKEIDSLAKIMISHWYWSEPLKYAQKHIGELKPILGERDYVTLIQYLKNRSDTLCRIFPLFQSYDWSMIYRDYLLWQNTKFAIDNLKDEKSIVAIYSHLAHLNKKVPTYLSDVKSLGQYINEYYGDDYYVVGMLAGEGTISTRSSFDKIISQKIQLPPPRSIEYYCSHSKIGDFYKTLPISASDNILYRRIGNRYNNAQEFVPSFTKGCMDAIIYIHKINEAKIYPVLKLKDPRNFDFYKKVNP